MAVRYKGPIFNGKAEIQFQRMMHVITEDVAEEGKGMVRDRLAAVLRTRTPYYETRIAIDRVTPFKHVVHDSKVVYGRWLEGVNEQNRITRFKGYHTFRLVAAQLRLRVQKVIRPTVDYFVRRMQ